MSAAAPENDAAARRAVQDAVRAFRAAAAELTAPADLTGLDADDVLAMFDAPLPLAGFSPFAAASAALEPDDSLETGQPRGGTAAETARAARVAPSQPPTGPGPVAPEAPAPRSAAPVFPLRGKVRQARLPRLADQPPQQGSGPQQHSLPPRPVAAVERVIRSGQEVTPGAPPSVQTRLVPASTPAPAREVTLAAPRPFPGGANPIPAAHESPGHPGRAEAPAARTGYGTGPGGEQQTTGAGPKSPAPSTGMDLLDELAAAVIAQPGAARDGKAAAMDTAAEAAAARQASGLPLPLAGRAEEILRERRSWAEKGEAAAHDAAPLSMARPGEDGAGAQTEALRRFIRELLPEQAGSLDANELAALVNEALAAQARLHGVDLS